MNKREYISQLLIDLFLPRRCCVCGKRLTPQELAICPSCLCALPNPAIKDFTDNHVARLFWGKVPIQKGASLLYYIKESDYQHILSFMKYEGQVEFCHQMGRLLASSHPLFEGVDAIVPVPLHRLRRKERGYNQAEEIAKGISCVTGIPVETTVVQRIVNTKSQTTLGEQERLENTRHAFTAEHAEKVDGKHLLIVDDTITTGATIASVMQAIFCKAPHCTFSVCSIALSKMT